MNQEEFDEDGEDDCLSTFEQEFSLVRHNHVERVAELLQQGFDCDARDRKGNGALHIAAQNGHKRMVKVILRAGADINCRNAKGNTPLHFCYMLYLYEY